MKREIDFGKEVSKIHPMIIRELTKRQQGIISRGFLTIPQIVILDYLAERGPCKMSELAKVLNFSMSAVTAIVDKMIELKLVKREHSSKDRRVINIIMLHKGREVFKRINKERRDIVNDIFSVLTKSEKVEYMRLLRKIYNDLKQRQ